VGPRWEKPGLPMWVLARAHVKPTFSPYGPAHMGPPWNPRTKLAGPHLGSPNGAHSPAHIQPLWAPHGCVDRDWMNLDYFSINMYRKIYIFDNTTLHFIISDVFLKDYN